jgi:CDP-paratose 2-epimerase
MSDGHPERPALITGGAGFIGTNLADRLAAAGRCVVVFDNLSRAGVERNLAWLKARHGRLIEPVIADIRDADRVRAAVREATEIYHLAAQVAVTTSLVEPQTDFAINAQGTLNVLEAVRRLPDPPPLLFTSTNKVYGELDDIGVEAEGSRYVARHHPAGIDERRPLDFHSPYGCSKGAADQYVHDYARSYGLDAVVFRMSCIYGPHQLGTEDQGWVAHFLIRAIEGLPITLFGDGLQVRDILYVDDLVEAMLLAMQRIDRLRGQAFNIGGGPGNATSLLDLLDRIAELNGTMPPIAHDSWRTGDQRYYVSDHGRFTRAAGWRPRVGLADGTARLYRWLLAERGGARRDKGTERRAPAFARAEARQ